MYGGKLHECLTKSVIQKSAI